ncbi:MAG: hypothetical protein HZY74_08030 [Brevundimonas sp.]|nr:MAG: hypothetical protein HZY74_08030 [Brevundimonas sp.]
MKEPSGLISLCRNLHQDVDLFANSIGELAAYCVDGIPKDDRADLKAWLLSLGKLTNAELKGVINRAGKKAGADIYFDTKHVRQFVDAVIMD